MRQTIERRMRINGIVERNVHDAFVIVEVFL
jgi:hypothetical protein